MRTLPMSFVASPSTVGSIRSSGGRRNFILGVHDELKYYTIEKVMETKHIITNQ
jgi:hypothetical protein